VTSDYSHNVGDDHGTKDHVVADRSHNIGQDQVNTDHAHKKQVTTAYVNSGHVFGGSCNSLSSYNAENSEPDQAHINSSDYTTSNHVSEDHAHRSRQGHVTTDYAHKKHVTASSGHSFSESSNLCSYNDENNWKDQAQICISENTTTTQVTEDRAQHNKPDHMNTDHAHKKHMTISQVNSGHAFSGSSNTVSSYNAENSGQDPAHICISDYMITAHANEDHAHRSRPDHVTSDHAHKKHLMTSHVTSGHAFGGSSNNLSSYKAENSGQDQAIISISDHTTTTHVTEDHAHRNRPDHVTTDRANEKAKEPIMSEPVIQPSRETSRPRQPAPPAQHCSTRPQVVSLSCFLSLEDVA